MSTPRPCDRFPIIPVDWSPEQALAAFELVNELRERIWTRYALDIQALLQQDQCPYTPTADDSEPDSPPF
jgi:hypothetical protein